MKARFLNLIDTVDAATHEIAIRRAISDFAKRLGFQRYAYFQGVGLDIKTFSNYPPAWEDDYVNNGYSVIDPVVRQAKQLKHAFLWNADNWTQEQMPDAVRNFADNAISHGLRSGLTIPVQGSFGRILMLTFASRKANRRMMLPENTLPLGNAVLAIHYNLLRVANHALISPKIALAPQESLCLYWSMMGKRHQEIAVLLEIGERTVQEYLASARKKLDASTVAQAVAISKEMFSC